MKIEIVLVTIFLGLLLPRWYWTKRYPPAFSFALMVVFVSLVIWLITFGGLIISQVEIEKVIENPQRLDLKAIAYPSLWYAMFWFPTVLFSAFRRLRFERNKPQGAMQ